MAIFENSKWIWIKNGGGNDEYADFIESFDYKAGQVKIYLSVDSDYTLFINGTFVESNQFCDFEHYKNYDEIDITKYLVQGKNRMYLLVWHFGKISMRYRPALAGAIYEVVCGDEKLCVSSDKTLSRKNPCYQNGRCKDITPQLGLGFAYDANNEDDCIITGCGFDQSVVVADKSCKFVHRVGQKMKLGKEKQLNYIKKIDDRHYLVDLGEETVGLPVLRFESEEKQKIIFAWGEHIIDGCVRRNLHIRDFSIEYTAKPGKNDYTNYMLRLGLRYVEIFAEKPISLLYAGVIPQYYPTTRTKAVLNNELDQRIYDLCVRTLELSMMEHYVDCPWREQCLYAFDSRNQMLCGYYAFEGGNAEYVKANIKLIINDTRADGLLSITYPSGNKLAIPSFSLHFYTTMREYYEHTGDVELLKEAYPKLISVMEAFTNNVENGLLKRFNGEGHWNFYDWSDNLSGALGQTETNTPDLVGNGLFIRALKNLKYICSVLGEDFKYDQVLQTAIQRTREAFFDPDTGLFTLVSGEHTYTALGNAIAITNGMCTEDEARFICKAIKSGKASPTSLSLKPFVYDALIMTDLSYKDDILEEIHKNYGKMLDDGATSAWETEKGAEDFGGAGSLCHGWSAIPVYYYNKFNMINN